MNDTTDFSQTASLVISTTLCSELLL